MELKLRESFEIKEDGVEYLLPQYEVVDGKGIVETGNALHVKFVRGSKLLEEDVEKKEGTLHEHLLAMMIHDLKFKNGLVPSRETALVITNLQNALNWLRQRQVDRLKRSVVGTYKK